MKRKILISSLIIFSIISSCAVISFYPLYTEDVLITNNKILGKWETIQESFPTAENDTLVWEITFDKDNKNKEGHHKYAYTLNLSSISTSDIKSKFDLHLIELDDQTYFNFFPQEWNPDNSMIAFHLMGVHTFAKVDIKTDSITINWFDADWFAEKLKENKIRIKHEKNSENILLTAKPKELQKFVVKYSNNKEAFNPDFTYILKPQK